MKTVSIIALMMFATATVSAQDLKMNDVPSNLQTAFNKTYANATDVEWEKEGVNYKVEFEINRMDHEIWYSADGKTVKSEMDMGVKSIPSEISNAIKKKYPDYKIDTVEVTEVGNKKTYEVEIEKGWTKERKLVLDATGKILSDIED